MVVEAVVLVSLCGSARKSRGNEEDEVAPGGAPPTDFRFRPRGEFRNGARLLGGVGLGLVTGFLAVHAGRPSLNVLLMCVLFPIFYD